MKIWNAMVLGMALGFAAYGLAGCGGSEEETQKDDALTLGTTIFQSTLSPRLNAIVEQVPARTQPEVHAFDGTFPTWDISGATAKVYHPLFWSANDFAISVSAGATLPPHFGINCVIYPKGVYPGVYWGTLGLIPSSWVGVPGFNFSGVYGGSYQVPLGRNSRNGLSTCSDESGAWTAEPIEVLAAYVPANSSTGFPSPKLPTATDGPERVVLRVDVPFPQYSVINRYLFAFSK